MKKINDKEIRNIQLNILKEIVNFCIENNLKYFLAYGSALGAVRHNGYIPWDDDLDIVMLRDDYNEFLKKWNNKNNKYKVLEFSLNNSIYPFTKVVDDSTYTVLSDSNEHYGIWVDIFPLDKCPSQKIQNKGIRLRQLILGKLVKKNNHNKIKYLIKRIIKFLFFFIPTKFLVKKILKLSQKFSNCETDYVANIVWASNGEKIINKNCIFNGEILKCKFENLELNIPSKYDEYLTSIYGDYMTPPPLNMQISHNFEAFYKENNK